MTEARPSVAGNRPSAEGESGGLRSGTYTLTDATPDRIRQLTRTVIGIHWTYQERVRRMLPWLCSTDRQFDLAEREWMEVATGAERALRGAIHQQLRGLRLAEEGTGDG